MSNGAELTQLLTDQGLIDSNRRGLLKYVFQQQIGKEFGVALAQLQSRVPDFRQVHTWQPEKDGGKGLLRYIDMCLEKTGYSIEATISNLRFHLTKCGHTSLLVHTEAALREWHAAAILYKVCGCPKTFDQWASAVLGWELEYLQQSSSIRAR